ncbi:hypothetical protein TrVE_jg6210 [Triparma verrucosa]|uniref:Uncharacterized protein n=2 Tax=Triparma TaxID=722752 RepID=A0A9W7EHQ9_9STRA|nr:hypothetical protein TrST_g3552 [Triparma strigata]GMH89559.1 hypothetical protein TrVE_jg6210 [Triparma verrucosa]
MSTTPPVPPSSPPPSSLKLTPTFGLPGSIPTSLADIDEAFLNSSEGELAPVSPRENYDSKSEQMAALLEMRKRLDDMENGRRKMREGGDAGSKT